MKSVALVDENGQPFEWQPSGAYAPPPPSRPFTSRTAFAAAHVVADETNPTTLDWEATMAFRHHLWSYGFGVAEAMDTAQRGMGLDWPLARELIGRTAREAAITGGAVVYGAATDQIPSDSIPSLDQISAAYIEQLELVEATGGDAIVMASRHLTRAARSPDDYLEVYSAIFEACSRPVLIHWLGEAFDPQLAGYWGSADPWQAADTVLALAKEHPAKMAGIKVSLLDDDLEVHLRRSLPPEVVVYTGDDFNFAELILGDDQGHSEALLGVFDPIAPVAAQALAALDDGQVDRYQSWLEPTVPFARHLFSAPTYHYKTGITFLAYLNGFQPTFRMLDGQEHSRSFPHLCRLLTLADRAALLLDPELAVSRASLYLTNAGVV